MPLYEYRCDDCRTSFERLVRKPETETVECPACAGKNVTQQISTFLSPVAGKFKPKPRHSKEHDVYSPKHDD